MSEIVVGPDCELLVIGYLDALLDVSVSSNSPDSHGGVRVTQVPFEGFVEPGNYRALLSIEAWAESRPAASDLARLAAAYLEVPHSDFYADCGSPGYLPDPDSDTPRYLFTAEVYASGSIFTP